jgi:hypothetical protein
MLPSSLGLGIASVGVAIVGGLFSTLFLLAVAIFVIGVSNRSDPDPRGTRPMAAYYFAAAFLFLWVAFFGLVYALDALVNLIGNHPAASGFFAPAPSYGNAALRACVNGGVLLLIVGGSFLLHLQRGNALAEGEADASSPTKKIMRSYVAFVSLVAILIFTVALAVALIDVFHLFSHTIFGGSASRTVTTRSILDALVLVVLAGVVYELHQRFAPDSLRLLSTVGHRGDPTAGDTSPPPPPSPVPTA